MFCAFIIWAASQAKELVEKAPVVIKDTLTKEDAEKLQKVLAEAGADIDARDSLGTTPCAVAAELGCDELLQRRCHHQQPACPSCS